LLPLEAGSSQVCFEATSDLMPRPGAHDQWDGADGSQGLPLIELVSQLFQYHLILIFEPPVELNGVASQILKAHVNATNFHHWRFLKKYP